MTSGPQRKPWSPNIGWRAWYKRQRWRKIRRHQLAKEPLCAMCLAKGRVTPATIADHVDHHGGDWNKFWTSALQSLCERCHNSAKKRGFSSEVGDDGWPLDPNHPANL
jgi:5-methylcytosine-specific restriction endonuclease McrA